MTDLRKYHSMQLVPLHPLKDLDVFTDWNDPKFYCTSYNTTYLTRKLRRHHCNQVHNMRSRIKEIQLGELPNLEDSEFHCKICNMNY